VTCSEWPSPCYLWYKFWFLLGGYILVGLWEDSLPCMVGSESVQYQYWDLNCVSVLTSYYHKHSDRLQTTESVNCTIQPYKALNLSTKYLPIQCMHRDVRYGHFGTSKLLITICYNDLFCREHQPAGCSLLCPIVIYTIIWLYRDQYQRFDYNMCLANLAITKNTIQHGLIQYNTIWNTIYNLDYPIQHVFWIILTEDLVTKRG